MPRTNIIIQEIDGVERGADQRRAWKAFFAGDVFISRPLPGLVSADLKEIIDEHDLVSCNFEAPTPTASAEPIPKAGVHLSQHPDAARLVRNAGFNVVTLGNNHMYDFGQAALAETIHAFDGLTTVGAGEDFSSAYASRIVDIRGVKVGLLAFCENEFGALREETCGRGGYAWINHATVCARIAMAKSAVDVLLVQAHAGIEMEDLPLPEWRSRYRELIDAGADAIVGHHPHVAQGWELYRGKPIFYSLGNFSFGLPKDDRRWYRGYAVSLSFSYNVLESLEILPVQFDAQQTTLCKETAFRDHLLDMCRHLTDDSYLDTINERALWFWHNVYRRYYRDALGAFAFDEPFRKFVTIFIRYLFGLKRSENNLLMLHNIRIESHRWMAERALSLLSETAWETRQRHRDDNAAH